MGQPVKRTYDASGRARQAQANRERIARVAHDLFAERGYSATTIADVAEAAGVSTPTMYKAFGNKSTLLRKAFFVMFRGDEQDVPLYYRPEAEAIREIADPLERLRAFARLTTERNRRSAPLLRAIQIAADTDEGARHLVDEWTQWLTFVATKAAEAFAETGFLAIPEDDCRDVLYATLSGDLWQRLVNELGWTDDRYAAWLTTFWQRQFFNLAGDT